MTQCPSPPGLCLPGYGTNRVLYGTCALCPSMSRYLACLWAQKGSIGPGKALWRRPAWQLRHTLVGRETLSMGRRVGPPAWEGVL